MPEEAPEPAAEPAPASVPSSAPEPETAAPEAAQEEGADRAPTPEQVKDKPTDCAEAQKNNPNEGWGFGQVRFSNLKKFPVKPIFSAHHWTHHLVSRVFQSTIWVRKRRVLRSKAFRVYFCVP